MAQSAMPRLIEPRAVQTLEMVRSVTGGGFDADAWHVMSERDNALIADQIEHGVASPIFVYSFEIAGHTVADISTKGAQYLAQQYGGLKHRIISALEKRGPVITFQRFDGGDGPPIGYTQLPVEMASEPDFYSVVVEVSDLKSGNSVQTERRELRYEKRRDGSEYERPNFQTIAQSKARRNGYLILIPQEVQIEFKQRMLRLGKNAENLTESLIDQKRGNVLRFAAEHGHAFDRRAVERLTFDQISGLGDAARTSEAAFVNAARGLGLEVGQREIEQQTEPGQAAEQATPSAASPPRRGRGRPPGPRQQPSSDRGEAGDDAAAGTIPPAEPVDVGQQTVQPPAQRQGRFGNFEV